MPNFQIDTQVIGILRGIDKDFFAALMEESFAVGLQALEVTLNTKDALKIIAENRGRVPAGKLLGIGTVCCLDDARRAIEAGAMFLVTPNFDAEVIRYAREQMIPVVSGALSPTEVYSAWKTGAAMIKVFPCQAMGGPQYIKELRGPFADIPLAAVGGVSMDNVAAYFSAGANAVGVSGSLFGKDALAGKRRDQVAANVKSFLDCVERVHP